MSLADTSKAIGAAAQLLSYQISLRAGCHVSVGPIEETTSTSGARLNIFLYETAVDASMRSVPLDAGQRPPLWMILRFLLTAFDSAGKSDTVAAHRVLGAGLAAIQELGYVPVDGVDASDLAALQPNPEPLKASIIEVNSEVISRLVQGSDERYRLSAAFELRPVMIAPAAPADYSLLVGIDYEAATVIGEDGIQIVASPGLQPSIAMVVPSSAAPGETVALYGEGLTADMIARVDDVELPLSVDAEGSIRLVLDDTELTGDRISAGPRTLRVVRTLASGRRRSSRPVVLDLQPQVSAVAVSGVAPVLATDPASPVTATLTISGALLGGAEDEVFVGLVQGGVCVASYDELTDLAGPAQTGKRLVIPEAKAVPAGTYRVVLRVGGVQARQSPEVTLEAP